MTIASNDIELIVQKRNTLAFIASAPVTVSLIRPQSEREEDRGGIRQLPPITLDPQTFRINHAPPRRRRKENQPPNASLGEIPFAKDNLMGRWDADVELGDKFTWLGVEYTVTYVFWDRTYETIANLGTTDQ
jgi:hypothetical protein